MLLANMAVARKIYKHYPEIAVLRRHPQPQSRMIDDVVGIVCNYSRLPMNNVIH
jgi:DIS3-like exonuclease 2